METKVCTHCKQEKPLEEFVVDNRRKDKRGAHCKECHNKLYPFGYVRKKAKIEFQPKVDEQTEQELNAHQLKDIPSRLLIHELRSRGYRGELELVTIQKVVI